jgi:hypothetical protein
MLPSPLAMAFSWLERESIISRRALGGYGEKLEAAETHKTDCEISAAEALLTPRPSWKRGTKQRLSSRIAGQMREQWTK